MKWIDYHNMKEAFDAAEVLMKDREVIRYMKRKEVVSVRTAEFHEEVRKYASAIVRMGLQGKHVALIGKNTYEYFVALCALLYSGTVSVMVSKDSTPEEICELCLRTDVEAMIYSYELEENMEAVKAECQKVDYQLSLIAMHETELSDVASLQTEKEKGLLEIENNTGLDDMINVLFTSGTTGVSKAVMHTNRSLMAGVIDPYMDEYFASILVVFPFHHIAGYCLALETFFSNEIICLGEDPIRITKYLETLKPEFIFVVPALMQIIVQKLKNHTQEELGWNVRCIGCGGAKSIVSAIEFILTKDIKLFQSYASSECAGRGIYAFITMDDLDRLGKAGYGVLTKIEDGELVMGGPSISVGYYNDPVQTAETFKDGWYYTGDLVRQDEAGNFYLTGRKKNLIILSNGENVSPEEIENVLSAHPEIQEILVREEGDVIGAVIYPDYSDCENDEERAKLKEKVQAFVDAYNDEALTYKQIHKVTVTDEPLPKTTTNKIKRY